MEQTEIYGFDMIQVKDILNIMKRKKAWLIDLRGEEAYRNGHIRYAKNYPIEYIDEWRREIPEKAGLILYCEHGNQSLLAARKLRGRKGKVYTVTGGYQAFLKEEGKDDMGMLWKKD